MPDNEMVQAENYWVSRDPGCRVAFQVMGTGVKGHGSTAVRYVPQGACQYTAEGEYEGLVWLTLGGHHGAGRMPLLIMSVDAAEELAGLLTAAVRDGRIAEGAALEPIPHRDITCDPCGCSECDAALVALLEVELGDR
ncbi:hypothetical protein ACFYO1_39240 [Nocardia sp. NPDC006044]|uniref:hypothetical protein n=1 Tax=Nocardia sp. NPDC006044 TaxID=3364306 RepID=UPI0036B84885